MTQSKHDELHYDIHITSRKLSLFSLTMMWMTLKTTIIRTSGSISKLFINNYVRCIALAMFNRLSIPCVCPYNIHPCNVSERVKGNEWIKEVNSTMLIDFIWILICALLSIQLFNHSNQCILNSYHIWLPFRLDCLNAILHNFVFFFGIKEDIWMEIENYFRLIFNGYI